jgi:hypothetical protein
MTLIVEDGTGLSNSNGYVSEAYVTAYFADRGGNSAWTAATTAAREAAIVLATDYIDIRFGFRGRILMEDQNLQWPRSGIFNEFGTEISGLPTEVEKATAEYAVRSLTASLAPDPTAEATGTGIRRQRVKAGQVETETEYATPGVPALFRPYPTADKLLRPFLSSLGARAIR